jgi:hypothetical protein
VARRRVVNDDAASEIGKQMTADNWLFVLVMGIIILAAYLAATKPKITEQERKEMEEEWWG